MLKIKNHVIFYIQVSITLCLLKKKNLLRGRDQCSLSIYYLCIKTFVNQAYYKMCKAIGLKKNCHLFVKDIWFRSNAKQLLHVLLYDWIFNPDIIDIGDNNKNISTESYLMEFYK
jgi:hypothetical protein